MFFPNRYALFGVKSGEHFSPTRVSLQWGWPMEHTSRALSDEHTVLPHNSNQHLHLPMSEQTTIKHCLPKNHSHHKVSRIAHRDTAFENTRVHPHGRWLLRHEAHSVPYALLSYKSKHINCPTGSMPTCSRFISISQFPFITSKTYPPFLPQNHVS